jgi:inosine-uridine nucleoside N-ribohydrolase
MPRRIIIDTDPGIDDAIAILLALAPPEALEILGIVAVAGNLPLALTERNARSDLQDLLLISAEIYHQSTDGTDLAG